MIALSAAGLDFVTTRHLATLTTLRPDGSPHVTAVGFTWDASTGTARVICSGTSRKAAHAQQQPRVALCQLDGRNWLSLEGWASVSSDPERIADAVARYALRYRQPRENPQRVVIEIAVDRLLGSTELRGSG